MCLPFKFESAHVDRSWASRSARDPDALGRKQESGAGILMDRFPPNWETCHLSGNATVSALDPPVDGTVSAAG